MEMARRGVRGKGWDEEKARFVFETRELMVSRGAGWGSARTLWPLEWGDDSRLGTYVDDGKLSNE